MAYTPVSLFAVCLLPWHQEVTPQAGDAGVPMVHDFMFFVVHLFIFASHSVHVEGSGGLQTFSCI